MVRLPGAVTDGRSCGTNAAPCAIDAEEHGGEWWPAWFRKPPQAQLVRELRAHDMNPVALRRIALAAESADQLERWLLEAMRLSAPIDRLPEFDGETTMLWEQATVTPERLQGTVHTRSVHVMALCQAKCLLLVPLADTLVMTLGAATVLASGSWLYPCTTVRCSPCARAALLCVCWPRPCCRGLAVVS